jgi:hypothetical protein
MTDATYKTLVERCADLCIKFKLNPLLNLWTHQEIVGWKKCPIFFCTNPNEWKLFKQKVADTVALKSIPQWQIDCVNWLLTNKITTTYHATTEPVTMNLFGYMMNNYITRTPNIEPMKYLTEQGYIKSPHEASEIITLQVFAFMMANRKNEGTSTPIDYLLKRGFLTSPRDANEKLTFWLLGAMLKNVKDKGFTI